MLNYISKKAIVNNVYIGDFVKILGNVEIGSGTYIDDFVIIGRPYKIFDDDFIEKFFQETNLNIEDFISKKTKIGCQSKIMRNSIISAGVESGEKLFCDFDSFIGSNTKIGNNVSVSYRGQIYNDVKIGDNSLVGGFVSDRCKIGNNVTTYGSLIHKYNFSKNNRPVHNKIEDSPVIKDYAVIGFGSLIIGGITVGEGAYVAAGSVVTKNVEPDDVVAGNPAKSIKEKVKLI